MTTEMALVNHTILYQSMIAILQFGYLPDPTYPLPNLPFTKYYPLPNDTLYQMLPFTKFYPLPNSTLYQIVPFTKCYPLPNATLYQMLCFTKCYPLPNATLYQILSPIFYPNSPFYPFFTFWSVRNSLLYLYM